MSRSITKKQKIFAKEYLDSGNGVQSALKAYDTKDISTAGNIASENLKKPKVIEYLEMNAQNVASNMVKLALKAKNEQVQVSAGKDVLDRAGIRGEEKRGDIFNTIIFTDEQTAEIAKRRLNNGM